jgi:AraC family transcriptional regulator
MAVDHILNSLGIPHHEIRIGEIHLCDSLDEKTKDKLNAQLETNGLEIIDNRLNQLIKKTKQLIIGKARNEGTERQQDRTLSKYLSQKLAIEYTYLSSLFSSVEGRTIENFFIEQ